jgi:hypothetical protein
MRAGRMRKDCLVAAIELKELLLLPRRYSPWQSASMWKQERFRGVSLNPELSAKFCNKRQDEENIKRNPGGLRNLENII